MAHLTCCETDVSEIIGVSRAIRGGYPDGFHAGERAAIHVHGFGLALANDTPIDRPATTSGDGWIVLCNRLTAGSFLSD